MKNKISLLIYKKLDNSITEKEEKLLNKYLEENKEFQEEYKLINNISEELKKDIKKELPADFNIKLREKLVNYNLNKDSITKKRRFLPVTTVATLLTAVFLVVFAFNDTQLFKNHIINENYGVSTKNTSIEQSEIQNGKQRAINAPVADYSYKADNSFNEASNDQTPSVASENNIERNKNTTEYKKENSDIPESTNHENSDIALTSLDYSDCIILKAKCDISLFNGIKTESLTFNTYKIAISDYQNVRKILENIPFEILNENEENLLKDYFILEIAQ